MLATASTAAIIVVLALVFIAVVCLALAVHTGPTLTWTIDQEPDIPDAPTPRRVMTIKNTDNGDTGVMELPTSYRPGDTLQIGSEHFLVIAVGNKK